MNLQFLDWLAFAAYFVVLFLIGIIAGRSKKTEASDYFLAGNTLPWYVVGSSYIAANISTEHFLGMIGAAVLYGICVATPEWSAVIAFTFLIWIFIPFLLTSKVYTIPEFLERRFNRNMRVVFAIITMIANIVAFMGPVIYGGGLLVEKVLNLNLALGIPPEAIAEGLSFNWGLFFAIIIIAVLAGGMAIYGGLKSVAWMDVLTIVIMVVGGLLVTVIGLSALGGGEGMGAGIRNMMDANSGIGGNFKEWIGETVPDILKGSTTEDGYNRLSVLQPINHYTNPWTHWVFSFFYIGLWYTVINQHMIQKVLAAKDMYHARMGMVFASFLKLLLPFIVVVPGLIAFAMKDQAGSVFGFLNTMSWDAMSEEVNNTYILMIGSLIPVVLKGILLAALFGAIQSTVSSVLNSTSTIFTLDFYKEFINRDASEQKEVSIGRISGAVILVAAIGLAVLLSIVKVNLFVYIQAMYTFIAPPFSALFLLGMLWRKVNGKDAMNTVIVSFIVAFIIKYLELGPLAEVNSAFANFIKPFGNQGLIVWIVAMITCTVSAFITPAPPAEQVTDDLTFNWKKMNSFGGGLGKKWYNNVTVWWAICIALLIVFIAIFS